MAVVNRLNDRFEMEAGHKHYLITDVDVFYQTEGFTFHTASMNKLTIHKQMNFAKYFFKWQKTEWQKEFFEDAKAVAVDQHAWYVNSCPMGHNHKEYPQHCLQCPFLAK